MSRLGRVIGRAPVAALRAEVTDDTLIERVAAGDLEGLGALYDRHAADLARVAGRLGAGAEVEDVVHTVFLRVVELAPRFELGRGCSARAWLAGITVRVVRERRRSVARWLRILGTLGREPQSYASPASSARADVLSALATLTTAQREAVVLVDGSGLTAEEAGEALGVPVGTIWSRVHHGRAALRARLGDSR